jgi:hypothetical protein
MYCQWHVKCQGQKKSGGKCGSRAVKENGYIYCENHPPSYLESKTDPGEFRMQNLLTERAEAVWKSRDGKDAYSLITKHKLRFAKTELDHVLELHVARDSFDKVKITGVGVSKAKDELKVVVKNVMNDIENLNHTLAGTNQAKFRGVFNFQQDYRYGRPDIDQGLVPYLREAEDRTGRKAISRAETRNISKEMVKSYDHVSENLCEEDSAQGQFLNLLHDNMVAMRIF